MNHSLSPRTQFINGVKAELPLLIGVLPFGMIYGVLALEAGLPPSIAQAMSAIVFAGSSQFVATQMISISAPMIIIVLTIGVVNLRHILYSASIAPYLQQLRPLWKWLLAYLLTDEAYAVTIAYYQKDSHPYSGEHPPPSSISYMYLENKHWFYLGAGLTLWCTWQASTAIGILFGMIIPTGWSLDFTLALTFIAILVPLLRNRGSIIVSIVAGLVAILSVDLPYMLGLVVASIVGILVGLWMEGSG